ncbi:restriction endonuclease subunit S [Psychromonas sp. KJ10-2]|uniref:restriction endonuclease subunit S n=1 Tax=Psychromonas sp. KJ10-2 TaxID=3391822 RepID=UPI0039B5AFBC
MAELASMEKYESYKDSGVDWLGDIPSEWNLLPLKYKLKFHTGGTPSSGSASFYNGDLPWVTISDLDGRQTRRTHYLSKAGVRAANIPLSPKNSLLYSFKLSIGQVAFSHVDLYTNEAIASFIPNDGINLNYYFYVLPIFLEHNAEVNIYGAKLLNQSRINNATILDISEAEQTAIANFLDKKTAQLDEALAIKEKQIELLKERMQIIIQQAVTQGLNSEVPMKDSGVDWIAEIPEHWEVKRAKYLFSEIDERSKNGDEELLSVSHLTGLLLDLKKALL